MLNLQRNVVEAAEHGQRDVIEHYLINVTYVGYGDMLCKLDVSGCYCPDSAREIIEEVIRERIAKRAPRITRRITIVGG
jgi:hypothetical protein